MMNHCEYAFKTLDLQEQIQKKKGQLIQVEKNKDEIETKLFDLQDELKCSEEALIFLQEKARTIQKQLEYRINSMVTSALSDIFPDPYEFKAEFEVARGRTECRLKLVRDGKEYSPKNGTGDGPVDVAAFALRPTCLKLSKGNNSKILILDEPFRCLAKSLHSEAGGLLQKMAKTEGLGYQILLATHSVGDSGLESGADKTFTVKRKGKVSKIK
jgi:hypothetical protein